MSSFIDNAAGNYIKLTKKNDINIFGICKVDSIEDYGSGNYKKLTVTHDSSNGSLILNQDYFVSNYDRASTSETYTHVQSVASSTWVITHNLGKFPSVMVIDSSGNVVVGEITYNSNNQITIQFSAPFAGKAYLN